MKTIHNKSLLLLLVLFATFIEVKADESVDQTTNLHSWAQSQPGKVLVIVVGEPECTYCKILKQDFLMPILRGGEFNDKVSIKEIVTYGNDTDFFVDFDNTRKNSNLLLQRYDITISPTLLFLDSNGNTLAPAIYGVSSPDYFFYRIETAMANAYLQLLKVLEHL